MTSIEEDARIGQIVAGGVELIRLLGAGAWGKVYLALHLALEKQVALKILHEQALRDPHIASRFVSEARVASRIDHPHCVRILDFGRDEETLFIAMEFLDGEDLHAILARDGALPAEIACRFAAPSACALGGKNARRVDHI